MTSMRKACWFVVMAFALACWVGMLGAFPGDAFAGVLPSRGVGSADPIQTFFLLMILGGLILGLLVAVGILTAGVIVNYLKKDRSQPGGTDNTAPAPAR